MQKYNSQLKSIFFVTTFVVAAFYIFGDKITVITAWPGLGRFRICRDDYDILKINSPIHRISYPQGTAARHLWLVYLDNADPGWRDFVDGVPAGLYVSNVAFKALHLPPGEHPARFENGGWGHSALLLTVFMAVGCAFSLLMVVCMIALVFRGRHAEAFVVAR